MKKYILDSFAILVFLKKEVGFEVVKNILTKAVNAENELYMSSINLGEVYNSSIRYFDKKMADKILNSFLNIPIKVISPDLDFTLKAALYKSKGNISYSDCFALTLTKQLEGTLLTGDREFKQFEKEIEIEWI